MNILDSLSLSNPRGKAMRVAKKNIHFMRVIGE